MTTFRKTVTATLAALTLATTFIASGAEARPRWRHGYGWGVGAGVVGAIAAGAIIAGATRPAYGYGYYDAPAPVRSCDLVERFDRWGNVIGYRRVCGYY
ncbi:hypothetical protein ARD30_03885 [Bosea thiooxidans]|uniref:Uncharacterized protein n=1 Tax=Bosea thiooxidans TaxID=53254 RepID=A0A0Q3PNX5_9HYPH|nr:hypothetical protein [Bosea thiooxidans]KQK31550.1 hypothetical protein ARD30_03885 [Bosea thiooxidans]SKB78143.1 hypothetical protein SAMN05660750_02304 [Bosea thiooxidans]